jgi:hypothetical protein
MKCGAGQSRFLCRCGTRYCSAACQKKHWTEHKAGCRLFAFKLEMHKAAEKIVGCWDESKYSCFMHCSKKDAIAAGYYDGVAIGDIVPDHNLTAGGIIAFLQSDIVSVMVSTRLHRLPNLHNVRCREWILTIPNSTTLPQKITTVMLKVRSTMAADMVLQVYAPEHACTGWSALHFFNYEKALLIIGPLMDID